MGAAKGLAFLHEAEKPVIYRDFKASNILLESVNIFDFERVKTKKSFCPHQCKLTSSLDDDLVSQDYTAKLSDFGLAKDGPQGDNTHVTTRVMGTHGYAAPEYVLTGENSYLIRGFQVEDYCGR